MPAEVVAALRGSKSSGIGSLQSRPSGDVQARPPRHSMTALPAQTATRPSGAGTTSNIAVSANPRLVREALPGEAVG